MEIFILRKKFHMCYFKKKQCFKNKQKTKNICDQKNLYGVSLQYQPPQSQISRLWGRHLRASTWNGHHQASLTGSSQSTLSPTPAERTAQTVTGPWRCLLTHQITSPNTTWQDCTHFGCTQSQCRPSLWWDRVRLTASSTRCRQKKQVRRLDLDATLVTLTGSE